MNKIDRDKVKNAFAAYVERYNAKDEKIKLKIDHTYRVAALCDRIARSEHLKDEEVEFAWLCGMLHDVGRFEQVRIYNTFNDSQSVDHGKLGAKILFDEGKIYDYVDQPEGFAKMLRDVIECHSAYRIPTDFNEKTVLFANILRDADKVDILKVNVDTPMEEIYNASTEDLQTEQITDKVMESFFGETCVLHALKRTTVDYVVGHISLVFELVFTESVRIAAAQGYLDRLMNYQSQNPYTLEQFKQIREHMARYISKRIN